MLSEIRHRRTKTTWQPLHEEPKLIKFMEVESTVMVYQQLCRGKNRVVLTKGTKFQLCKMNKS